MELVVIIIVVIIIAGFFKPSRCDVCGTTFKKTYYTWKIDGKTQHLCPYCNGKMNRRQSTQKFKDRFG